MSTATDGGRRAWRPFEASIIDRYPDRAAWDAQAADLVGRMLERWELTARDAFVGGEAGSTLLVEQADGSPAVLKVGYPHLEAIWEAVALAAWAPLTPLVLRQDTWTWALLLELVSPGLPLAKAEIDPVEAAAIGARAHAQLTAVEPPEGLMTLEDHVGLFARIAQEQLPGWTDLLDGLDGRSLVERAVASLHGLAASSTRQAFLHGDFNPGNLLAVADGTWKVIDPNPLVGDPAFDPWPLIEQLGAPWQQRDPAHVLERNAAIVCPLAGIDQDRMWRWAFGRVGLNVTWYLEDGDLEHAAAEVAKLRVLLPLVQ